MWSEPGKKTAQIEIKIRELLPRLKSARFKYLAKKMEQSSRELYKAANDIYEISSGTDAFILAINETEKDTSIKDEFKKTDLINNIKIDYFNSGLEAIKEVFYELFPGEENDNDNDNDNDQQPTPDSPKGLDLPVGKYDTEETLGNEIVLPISQKTAKDFITEEIPVYQWTEPEDMPWTETEDLPDIPQG